MTSKIASLIAALAIVMSGCTGGDPATRDLLGVALTTPVEILDGATLEDEVLERADQVCSGIRRPFISFESAPEEPGIAVEVHVALKARTRFCEEAPDCFFGVFTVARVPLESPSEPQVDVEALVTTDDPCWEA